MESDLHLLKEVIEELEGLAINTSNGSFVKMEDVRRLAAKRQEAKEVTAALPAPKTMVEAKVQAKEFLATQNGLKNDPREPGRAIPATEPQPASRP